VSKPNAQDNESKKSAQNLKVQTHCTAPAKEMRKACNAKYVPTEIRGFSGQPAANPLNVTGFLANNTKCS
jgi:hypothetical protein